MAEGSKDSSGGGRESPDGPIIGIDLGMTSAIAAYVPKSGEAPVVIPQEKNRPALPAVVSFVEGRAPVVGRKARDMLTIAPEQTVTGIKRLLGRKFDSQAVRDLDARVGYHIAADSQGRAVIQIGERQLLPEQVAGQILARVAQFATDHLRADVARCVVAVPAYFNDVQKTAVRDAARSAGLDIVKLVHEPTAVALAYGYNRGDGARVVILDMGGIRLDVSVMEISGNVFDVIATGGDPYLGGANLDARIAEWILTNIKKKFGRDLTQEPRLLMKVRTAAEQAKKELGKFRAVDLQIPLEVVERGKKPELGQLRLKIDIVEKLADDLVKRVVGLVQHVLKERGLGFGDIDDIILVGGGTRLPLLRRRIEGALGREPRTSLPPEEVIALGSALLADSIGRGRPADSTVVQKPIGIALADGRFMRIIDRDSQIPITRRVMIPTTRDEQPTLELDLYEGEDEDILDADYLGTIVYRGIEPAKAGEAKVVVDLTLEEDGTLKVSSPEPGRANETFEFVSHNGTGERKSEAPAFLIAKGVPQPGSGQSAGG